MPQALVFLLVAAQAGALGAGITAVIGTLLPSLLTIGVSIGASFLSSLIFAPKQPKPEDVQSTVKNPTASRIRHYGRVKTSGSWAFGDSKRGTFHKVLALGTGEIDAFEEYWIDDRQVTLDVDGFVTTGPWYNLGNPVCRILTRRGLSTETYYPELEVAFSEWDLDHRGDGVPSCYAVQKSMDPKDLPNNFPNLANTNYRFVIRGAKVFDPVSETSLWSDNAALVVRDYMTHADGMRLPESLFTTTNASAGWIAAQDRANNAIPLKAGGTEPAYRLWGSYSLNERPADVLGRMLASCDSRIMPTPDGGFTLDIGTWAEPSVVLDSDSIVGFNVSKGRDILTTANVIAATYFSPNHDYQAIDADRWIDDDSVALRGEIVSDMSFNMAPSHAQCRRLMKLAAYRANPNWVGSFQCNLGALAAFGQRFVRIVYPPFGIDEVFEIKDFKFNIGEGQILSSVTLDVQSMPSAAYSWDAATEEGTEPINEDTDVSHDIPIPDNFGGTIVATTTGAGTTSYALLTFDNPPDDGLSVQAEGRRVGDTDWIPIPVAQGATSARSFGLDDLVEYEFHVRNVSTTGRTSEWSATLTLPTLPSLDFSLTGNSQYLPLL